METIIESCRICKSKELTQVICLYKQYITSRFPDYGDWSTPNSTIALCKCENCFLLQLISTISPNELYETSEYGYKSGITKTMRNHLRDYKEEILSKVDIRAGDIVLDIGSNDATMLHNYSPSLRRIGIDPTGNQFINEYIDNNIELLPTYFTLKNFTEEYGENTYCKVISSIAMFYDLPDPVKFAKDIYDILDNEGIWTCEQSYLPRMIETKSIDTICHEHLEYYSLHQIKIIADMSNLKIIDIKFNECNGGSFRIYFAKQISKTHTENISLIEEILEKERKLKMNENSYYTNFIDICDKEINKLTIFLKYCNLSKKSTWIYGASTKGNCLLQYAEIGEDKIQYAVERNLDKVGKMTSTGIEIISEEHMRECPPDFLLVLPWHFRDEIIKREDVFLNNGGQLIFLFPEFEIISVKPKVIITGCDGMIASYVKKILFPNYSLYGISRENMKPIKYSSMEMYQQNMKLLNEKEVIPISEEDKIESHYIENNSKEILSIFKFAFNITNSVELENTILIIKPEVIIHLASISSSQYAFTNPLETININGISTVSICEIIHRNKLNTKLFNASSSDIYKGHEEYNVIEGDSHMVNLHPYAISKIMGTQIVDFYRKTYNLPFSNGILFTIESPLKSSDFLLNKVINHAQNYNSLQDEPLILGNLDSYRNILHAYDASIAIRTIIHQSHGDTYSICNNESVKILDVVIKIYEKFIINIIMIRDNDLNRSILIDVNTRKTVVIILDDIVGLDSRTKQINIKGCATKLKSLGWYPTMNIDDIIDDLCSRYQYRY